MIAYKCKTYPPSNSITYTIKTMKKNILLNCLYLIGYIVLTTSVTYAQDLYWVGGTGNWNDQAHWSNVSGGSGGTVGIPVSTSNIFFDANSFDSPGQEITVTTGATCATMSWSAGVLHNPTLNLANGLTITGSGATFADAMTITGTNVLTFSSTGNVTVNLSNTTKTFGDILFPANTARNVTINTSTNAAVTQNIGVLTIGNNATIAINGASRKIYGGLTIGNNFRLVSATDMVLTNSTVNGPASFGSDGNFQGAGFVYGLHTMIFNGNLTLLTPLRIRNTVINAGASVVGNTEFYNNTVNGSLTVTAGGNLFLTFFPSVFNTGSTIIVNSGALLIATASSQTFRNNFILQNNSQIDIGSTQTYHGTFTMGNNVIANFTGTNHTFLGNITAGTGNTITFSNTGSNSFQNITVGGSTSWRFNAGGTSTIAGSFTANATCANPVNINSHTGTTQATVNFNSFPNTANVNIANINNTGPTINLVAGNSANTTNIGVVPRMLYWVGGNAAATTSNWNDPLNWSSTSGGTGGECPPTVNDDVFFNALSFTATKNMVTINVDAFCRSMNWTGATNTPVLAGSATRTLTIAGNLTLITGMNQTGTGTTFLGKAVFASTIPGRTLTMAGKAFANVDFNGPGGSWQLNDSFTTVPTTGIINLIAGDLNTNNRSLTAGTLTVNNVSDLPRSLLLGNQTHILNGTGTVLDLRGNTSNFNLNSATSTINFTNTGTVAIETGLQPKTLPNLTFPGATAITINTSNTSNRITFGTIAVSNNITRTFTVNGTSPKTYGNITIDGTNNVLSFDGASSVAPNDNIFGAVTFTDNRTGTVATFNGNNTYNGAINIHSAGGTANDVRFTGTTLFNNTFIARLASTTGTELQFAASEGTTTFNNTVSVNPNHAATDIIFNNATTFGASVVFGNNSNLVFQGTGNNTFAAGFTLGNTTTTTFQGTGSNSFATVTVNHSSNFTLNNTGNSSFAAVTLNSQSGPGVTWRFRSGGQASFTGDMIINAACTSPVNIQATTNGIQARASFANVQTFNNQVLVQDIDASAGAVINAYATPAPTSPNNANVLYNAPVNRTLYWVGNTGSWNNSSRWSTSSGGVGGACPPTASDDVVFDDNSFNGPNQVVTINTNPAFCRNMTWTSGVAARTPVLSFANNSLEINGNLTLSPGMTMTSSGPNATVRFQTNATALNTMLSRTITIPAGTTAALPAALFNSVGVTWTLSGAGPFIVTNQTGLQAGIVNTNSLPVVTGTLNANLGTINRALTLNNTALTVTGKYDVSVDFRGTNFTFTTPGSGASITFPYEAADPAAYTQFYTGDVNPGSPRTTALLRVIPELIIGVRDMDIITSDYNVTDAIANRITFRQISNLNGGQFYISGTSPKTYGAISVANNTNEGDAFAGGGGNENRFEGSTVATDPNIFSSTVTFAANCSFRFDGINRFDGNFTMGTGSQLFTSDACTFNGTVTINGTQNQNNAVRFAGNNIFNNTVSITANSINRVTPTVVFNDTNGSTIFNQNATFSGSQAIYRFSGAATSAASRIMTFGSEATGWFVGGNLTDITNAPIPGPGVYTINGTLVLNAQARTTFYNAASNVYNNITLDDYAVFEFTAQATSTVTGTFSASGSCNVWRQINSSVPGTQAIVNFSNNQTWSHVLARDLNIPGAITNPRRVTANNSTNVGGSCTGNILFTTIPTTGTLVWVGGHKDNISGNSLWSDPRNWSTANSGGQPTNPVNGGSCIPSSLNNVLFNSSSFSSTTPNGSKFYDRVIVDIPVATCANMTWEDNIPGAGQSKLMTSSPTNELWVHGSLRFKSIMDNQFTGTFSFRYPTTAGAVTQTITSDAVIFRGPVEVNSVGAVYRLVDPMVIEAADLGGTRRGNLTIANGTLRAEGRNITLNGNWIVNPTPGLNPLIRFEHGNNTVTFNGQNTVNGAQNIVTNDSPFWNLVINRGSAPVPTDVVNDGVNNAFRWVIIQNKRALVGNPPPGNAADTRPFDSGMTVDNNLTITQGGLYDNGFQIMGSATNGILSITDNGVLSIGSASAASGSDNNNPMTTLFPTGYIRARVLLTNGSTVSYSAQGHQDVSSIPVYGNLYSRNATPNEDGLATLTGGSTRKRLSLGTNALPLIINNRLTLEQGILFYDMGNQISVGAAASLTMQSGSTLMLGSGNQVIATTTGTGYDPANNQTGTTTITANATVFPAFTDANININANSNVVYASSLAQNVRGNLNAATAQRYGNLVLVNPATALIQKTIQTGPVRVNNLVIHPNANLVDNGNQINGTSGSVFAMNYLIDPLSSPFNGQIPNSTGITTSATPFDLTLRQRNTQFGFRFEGFITIPTTGTYTFFTASDDGSMLSINGTIVVNNNFDQGTTTRSGIITLAAGVYPITVTYHQGGGGFALSVEWQGPGIGRQVIPASVLRRSASGPAGAVNYSYYEAPAGSGYTANLGSGSTPPAHKSFTNVSVQNVTQTAYYAGESRLVLGTATVSTNFPENYASVTSTDLNFDLGTTIVYNAGLAQTVRGLGSAVATQQYANLWLTNPVASLPRVVSKTLSSATTIRQNLIINPNNNFIDNGNQITGTVDNLFAMQNATLAINPVTNTGTVGTTGESRITLGNATTATTFPGGYNQTAGTDINFEPGTTVVYNAGVVQTIAGLSNTNVNGRYAHLMLTNPALTPTGTGVFPIVKTLNRAITVRGNITVNPNNTFADGDNQVTGTSGSTFSMFNASLAQTVIPETGVITGTTGESRFVVGSNGGARTFPAGFRTGDGAVANPSDINFETGTTIVYNANTAQTIKGLGGSGITTYANLVLTNPSNSTLANKTLTTSGIVTATGTVVRGTLIINPNNNLIDNGFQITGVAGQTFSMRNVTRSVNYTRALTTQPATIGNTGESRLTVGTATVATTFPGGYVTLNSTDIDFELGTTVVYNAGIAQQIQGIFNSSAVSNANYAHLSFVNAAAAGSVTKTLTNRARVRQNLTIGGVTAGTASGVSNLIDVSASNFKINLGGNWFTHPNNSFQARAGEVELEGTVPQNITTRNIQNYVSELGTQDFFNLTVNNTTAVPTLAVTLGSNIGVAGTMNFQRGLVQSSALPTFTTSPTNQLLIFRHGATAVNASDASFAIGAVRKVGQATGTFLFPVGILINGTTPFYRPSGLSGVTDVTTPFISQYYLQHPSSAGFNTTLMSPVQCNANALMNVSAREFWMVNRENAATGNAFVTLTWREPESGGVGTNGDPLRYEGLRVSRWNGALWQNMGGDPAKFAPYMGSLTNNNGALTSMYNASGCATNPVDAFSPFTLASEITFNPLPVTLIDFRGEVSNRQVNLSWQTSSEVNTSHFVVERSRDGKNFERVTDVAATGNSTGLQLYRAADATPYTGISYYRLRIVDADGTSAYSKVIKVTIDLASGLGEIVLFPNPSDGRNINFKLADPAVKVLAIYDLLGRTVGFRTSWNTDGSLAVNFTEVLAKGTYVAILVSADGTQNTRIKFVVQ